MATKAVENRLDSHERDAVETETQRLRDAADRLKTEQSGIPALLDTAIETGDTKAVTALIDRKRTVQVEWLMAELAYWKSQYRFLQLEEAAFVANRETLRNEAYRLGKAAGYPEGKEAGDKAGWAYDDVRGVSCSPQLQRARNEMASLKRQLTEL